MADRIWLRPFERLLDRRIAESESAQAQLAQLSGRRFGIRMNGLPWIVRLHAQDGRLQVDLATDPAEPDAELDAWVAGSALTMASAATGRGERLIREGALQIYGDAEIAERFWALLQTAAPEWEEELARIVGDLPAHQFARGVRAVVGFAGRTAATLSRDVAEYLQEESRDLVGRYEQEDFFRAVDRLRDDAERLEARIARLARRTQPEEGS